jgi:hypothetical protein
MSTLSVVRIYSSPAHAWFEQHLPELTNRAAVFVRRFPRGQRDDAVAENLALVWKFVLSAAAHGNLARLTTFTVITFAGRSYAAGRRLVGANTTDVYTAGVCHPAAPKIQSLDQPRWVHTPEGAARLPLSEVLAHRRAPNPLEAVRQDLDYAGILRGHKASRKSRQVFALLAKTHGMAKGVEIARVLHVSPPRVVQLKYQLAQCLAAEGYGPPPTRPDGRPRRKRGRPRRHAPLSNVGSSPPAGSGRSKRVSRRR